MEIVEFLTACLDEDERIARAIEDEEQQWNPGDKNLGSAVVGAEYGAAVVVGPYDYLDWSVRKHIAEHDPARVLREIDAKRRTLIRCEEAMLSASPMLVHFAKQTVWEMAQPYAGRSGFREEWAP